MNSKPKKDNNLWNYLENLTKGIRCMNSEGIRYEEYYSNIPYLNECYRNNDKSMTDEKRLTILKKGIEVSRESGDIKNQFQCLGEYLEIMNNGGKKEDLLEVFSISTVYLDWLKNENGICYIHKKADLLLQKGRAMKKLKYDGRECLKVFLESLKYREMEGQIPFDHKETESDFHTYLGNVCQDICEIYKDFQLYSKATEYSRRAYSSFFHPSKVEGDRFTCEDLALGLHVSKEFFCLLGRSKKYVESNKFCMKTIQIYKKSKFNCVTTCGMEIDIYRVIQVNLRNLRMFKQARKLVKQIQELRNENDYGNRLECILVSINLEIGSKKTSRKNFESIQNLMNKGTALVKKIKNEKKVITKEIQEKIDCLMALRQLCQLDFL